MSYFWNNLFRRKEDGAATQDLLAQTPIFSRLNSRERAAVERILYRREYAAGEVIFRQEEPGVGMYLIEEGVVQIIYEPDDRVLARLTAGDFFGEIALLNETPRSATARAKTAAVLWGFFQPEFLDLLERNPRLGLKIMRPLAQITGQRLVHGDEELHRLHAEIERLRQEKAPMPQAAAALPPSPEAADDEA